MKTITMKVYNFLELSESAREKVKARCAEVFGYTWDEEALESLKSFCHHFDSNLANYEIDFFNSSPSFIRIDESELTSAEIWNRIKALGKYNKRTGKGIGECVLTGFCMDESLADGIRIAWRQGERNLKVLIKAGFESWLKACQVDCEDFYSDSTFGEHCKANGYLFFADGTRYKGESHD